METRRIGTKIDFLQYKWVALTVTTVGTLMSGVDARIVLVGLPSIAQQLGAGVEQVIWVSQAYLLASTLGLLLIGRTTDLVGRVRIYNYGFIIFTVGSAFAAISFSPAELIASRIVQGVGASMLITNSTAILTDATPRKELGTVLGINNIAYRIGSITGLTLSGVILSVADWRALFYINIPIGIFGTAWAHYRLKEISTKDSGAKMDWAGFLTFSSGLALLLLAITFLSYGISGYDIGFAMLTSGAALLLFFIRIEQKTRVAPLLDLKLFKIKEFAGGTLAMMIDAISWSGILIMISFYLQIVLGESPLIAGLHLLALDATFIVLGPISGKLSDRHGTRLFSIVGLVVISVAFFMLASITPSDASTMVLVSLAVLGVGSGLFVAPNISSIMGSVPANRRGVAAGFRNTLLNVGDTSSFGLAILLMSLVIPYGTFNALLQSTVPQAQLQASLQEFIGGFHLAALALATINVLAIIPAAMAAKKAPTATLQGSLGEGN